MTPTLPAQLLFLPGALGITDFWQPVSQRLTSLAAKVLVGYPGFGTTPTDPAISNFDDLARSIINRIDRPTAIIAQSMGGVLAIRAALARPEYVTHLVLAVTSGGLNTAQFGAVDWRAEVRENHPALPDWFTTYRIDLTQQLQFIETPTLLLWGDADPLSPVAVGKALAARLPHATLHVIAGGEHDLAYRHAEQVATWIDAHLRTPAE